MPPRVAILTISDTASTNAEHDRSGPAIRDIVVSEHGCEVKDDHRRIVPDEIDQIRAVIVEWATSGHVDWIITTGGTGFNPRDVTPEAITPLIERHAPGLVHLMLSSSLESTRFAALGRPVAGVIKSTLVTSLPGSVRAVKENLASLFQGGVVNHAIELLAGGSGKEVHAKLAETAGTAKQSQPQHQEHRHHHHHHHHTAPKPRTSQALSHDPTAPASSRHRKSPYVQISLETALNTIFQTLGPLPIENRRVNYELTGYVIAEDVYAPMNIPIRHTTSVDGYALKSSDKPGIYNVLTAQSHPLSKPIPDGSIYRINTGGPLPAGADTVIMVEDTRLVSTHAEGPLAGEEKQVETLAQIPPNENVRFPGSDVKKGELVIHKGDRITSGGDVSTLAFVGRREVDVFKKPVVALLSTGNELVDLQKGGPGQSETAEGWGGIFDSNRPALHAALHDSGYEVVDLGIVPDDIDSHVNTLKQGLAQADLILTTGGTSMGPTDLLKPVIERYLNGTIHFGRVSIKPGKPTTFATVPTESGPKPIFALPGNPASALVTFYVFVLPSLRKLGGWPEVQCALPKVPVQIQNDMPLDPRVEFHRVVLRSTGRGGPVSIGSSGSAGGESIWLKAFSTGGQRSSRAASLFGANGLVVLPALPLDDVPSGQRKAKLEVGEVAEALVIGEIETAV